MAEQIAQFRFKGYKILKSKIEIKNNENISDKLKVEFNLTQSTKMEESAFKLSLGVLIDDKNSEMNIDVLCDGYFVFDSNLDKDKLDMFFNTNAPAILFPYLRAYITALTSLSGVKPVILPTLNLSDRKRTNDLLEKPEI